MKYSKKQSKEKKKERLKNLMNGTGVYLYENNTDADLSLPKPSIEGFKLIGPRKQFKGDSYFMSLVKTPLCLLRLIKEIKTEEVVEEVKKDAVIIKNEEKKEPKAINSKRRSKKAKRTKNKKGKKMKEKLVLDQPDIVTQNGKLEQQDLENQKEEVESQEEKLLIENPSGNIEIISE